MLDETPYLDFFDADFYARQLDGAGPHDLEHFLAVGDAAGLDPGPYFSTRYYKSRYPDWRASGARTALEDFLLRVSEGDGRRQPHPLIDPVAYRSLHADLADLGHDAVLHFVRHGDAEARRPSEAFDSAFYARCYLPIGAGNPFRHYAVEGKSLGNLPRPSPMSRADSANRMRHLVQGLNRPLVFAAHDAQKAGVPILTLDLADHAISEGWQPVFLLLRGGPLLQRFRDRGPVALIAEGWDADGIADALPAAVPVVANTAMVADLARVLCRDGRPGLLLIHEMAAFLHRRQAMAPLRAARAAGVRMAVSMPRMVAAFQPDLGTLPVLRPGLVPPRVPLSACRRVRRAMGTCRRHRPIFIGAGHADRRKGFDLFLSAAAALARRRPDARFVWLGDVVGEARNQADAARSRGLDLTLPGFVEDAAAWYLAASVYLLTSRQDPGPTTVMQAGQVGTPFVGYAADIGLIGQVDGFGMFVPPGDEAGFVAAALGLVSFSPADRRDHRRRLAPEIRFDTYARQVLAAVTAC